MCSLHLRSLNKNSKNWIWHLMQLLSGSKDNNMLKMVENAIFWREIQWRIWPWNSVIFQCSQNNITLSWSVWFVLFYWFQQWYKRHLRHCVEKSLHNVSLVVITRLIWQFSPDFPRFFCRFSHHKTGHTRFKWNKGPFKKWFIV